MAPEIVAWIDEYEITEWPDIQENDNLVDELPSFNDTDPFSELVAAFAPGEWDGDAVKLTALIMDRWPDPKGVPRGD